MGAPTPLAQTLIPDNMDNSLSYSVLNYLKRLKNQAKIEFDRLCNEVLSKQLATANMTKNLVNGSTTVTEGVRVIPRTPLKKDLVNICYYLLYKNICVLTELILFFNLIFRYHIHYYKINLPD